MGGVAGGGRSAARWCSDVGGRGGEEGDDVGDCGPPSTGWLHREEEEDEAETTASSICSGAAVVAGDLKGGRRRPWLRGRGRLRRHQATPDRFHVRGGRGGRGEVPYRLRFARGVPERRRRARHHDGYGGDSGEQGSEAGEQVRGEKGQEQVGGTASEGHPGRRGVILASNTAGEETGSVRHGTGGMAPVPPGTVEKKTMFSTKTPWQI